VSEARIVQHRRPDGSRMVGPTWESLVERQIREAMDEGAFDSLPFRGERIPLEDDSAAGEWAMGFRILRRAGAAPAWIEADREVRARLAERDRLLQRAHRTQPWGRDRDRSELRRIVAAANAAVLRLDLEAPTDRQRRVPLDIDAELAALARAHGDG
jgi:hypothetical protein